MNIRQKGVLSILKTWFTRIIELIYLWFFILAENNDVSRVKLE